VNCETRHPVRATGRSVAELAGEYGHSVVALADSTSAVVDESGVDVAAALERKNEAGTVGDAAPEDALNADYDVLVEATPTTLGDAEPGFSHVRAALEADRHVVLANKGPVAERYDDDARALERDSDGEFASRRRWPAPSRRSRPSTASARSE